MRNIHIYLTATLMLFSANTYAADCASLLKQVDEILESMPSLDEETIVDEESNKTVKQMRMEGEGFLEDGKNDECAAVMEKALEMLKDQV